ncbi:AbrB/MazE/SpoVT family DNA-binding domain-containing protein [Candidatus Woesearchaeota archaeon]|nr:AbrB/MazE/SpoVT family DNA-binding domain-containing protein [Candidatus Woesearchaeota archaeon]
MKRKIVAQGIKGRTIFLPIAWVRDHHLDSGDEIEINELEGQLIISASTKPKKQEIVHKLVAREEPLIRVTLNNLYRMGYDKIILFTADKQQEKIVENVVERFLLGFDIISAQNGKMTIESITEPSGEKQQTILRRMFLTTQECFELVEADVATSSYMNLRKIEKLTQRFGQYDNFCRRNISKKRFTEQKSHFYWSMYTYLLLIQHALLHFYEDLTSKKSKIDRKGREILAQIAENYRTLMSFFFKEDGWGIQQVTLRSITTLEETKKQLSLSNGTINIFWYYCGELSRLVYLATAPIQGVLLDISSNNDDHTQKQDRLN